MAKLPHNIQQATTELMERLCQMQEALQHFTGFQLHGEDVGSFCKTNVQLAQALIKHVYAQAETTAKLDHIQQGAVILADSLKQQREYFTASAQVSTSLANSILVELAEMQETENEHSR